MNKRYVILGILCIVLAIVGKLLYSGLKNFKPDEFHKSAIIFVVDSSASNQKMLPEQIRYIKYNQEQNLGGIPMFRS